LAIDDSSGQFQESGAHLGDAARPEGDEQIARLDQPIQEGGEVLHLGAVVGLPLAIHVDCFAMKSDTAKPGTPTENIDAIRLMLTLKSVAKTLHEDLAFRESYLAANADLGALQASARLAELRETLTLHAHSQGAIAAAVAQSRLGTLASFEPVSGSAVSSVKPVPAFFRLVTYGGGANMHDFLEVPYYASYTHHVNEKDVVAWLVGMTDPLQRTMTSFLRGQVFTPGSTQVSRAYLLLKYPHTRRLLKGPSRELIESLRDHHELIRFKSDKKIYNDEEHNFVNGYFCKVGLDPISLPTKDMGEYKARDGGTYCITLTPQNKNNVNFKR